MLLLLSERKGARLPVLELLILGGITKVDSRCDQVIRSGTAAA